MTDARIGTHPLTPCPCPHQCSARGDSRPAGPPAQAQGSGVPTGGTVDPCWGDRRCRDSGLHRRRRHGRGARTEPCWPSSWPSCA